MNTSWSNLPTSIVCYKPRLSDLICLMLHSQDDPDGETGEFICVIYKVNLPGKDLRRKCRSQAWQLAVKRDFVS